MPNYVKINNKRVLVTGGAGFIGSNLCEDLLKSNNHVICLDNFSTGHFINIQGFIDNPFFKLIVGDIRNINDCRKAVDGVDLILHEAALGSVPRSINDPITTNEVNVSGFLNILVAARDAKVGRIIYAASSSTYGDSENLPKKEEIIGRPLSPYAITKFTDELYADVFSKTYNMQMIGLRYFNVFGKNQDPNGAYAAVIPKFILQLLQGERPVINGDGTISRDFTYIDNVIQMNHLAATIELSTAYHNVFNTAVGERNNLNQLFALMRSELTELDPEIRKINAIYSNPRVGDIAHSHADISKAKTILNYSPSHLLADGLKESIKWYYDKYVNK